MRRLFWTPQSIQDLESIQEYIDNDSPQYANLMIDRLLAAVDHLLEFPESGRIVPEFYRSELREVLYRNYRIVYRLSETKIEVLTVFHGSRNLDLPGDLSGIH